MNQDLDRFDECRHRVDTASGQFSYVDTGGDGPVALFVHGVGTSSYLWRKVIDRARSDRRCVALDLPLHGETADGQRLSPHDQTAVGQRLSPHDQTAVGQGFSPPGQGAECAWRDYSLGGLAGYLTGFCDALGLTDIDLVANDTGGAIAQIFASRQPDRLRSLTLTNCETHNNVPPRLLLPSVWLARAGLFAPFAPRLLRNLPRARKSFYGPGYQNVEVLPLELVRRWQQPLVGDRRRAAELQRWLAALRPADLLAAEPALRKLRVPTLLVWGTDDRFFSVRWAYRLRDTMPSVRRVVEVPGARLFFPDERPDDLTAPLLEHWHSAAASTA